MIAVNDNRSKTVTVSGTGEARWATPTNIRIFVDPCTTEWRL